MTTKYFCDEAGTYLGAFDGVDPPIGSVEVPIGPSHVQQRWLGDSWSALPAPPSPYLTRRQLLLGLLSIDIREADVEAKIALLPADQVEAVMIEWKDASEYKRDDPLVSTLAASFGLPDNQVDDLWVWASRL